MKINLAVLLASIALGVTGWLLLEANAQGKEIAALKVTVPELDKRMGNTMQAIDGRLERIEDGLEGIRRSLIDNRERRPHR